MSRKETLLTRYGELLDLIDCRRIASGYAKVKKRWSFDDVMQLR